MISLTIAKKYAKDDCIMCKGEGVVKADLPDGNEEDYCLCVITNEEFLNSDE